VATLRIPNFRLAGEAEHGCGIPWPSVTGEIRATEVVVVATVRPSVDPQTGRIAVVAAAVNVDLQGYTFDFTNLSGQILNFMSLGQIGNAVRGPIEDAVARAVRTDLPPRLEAELNGLFAPVSRTFLGRTVTFTATPSSFAVDGDGMTFACAANTSGPVAPGVPSAPGSYFDAGHGLTLPLYPPLSPNLSTSVLSNAANRALFTSFEAGFWNVHMDQAFVNSLGLGLPVKLDTDLLRPFVQGLSAVVPANVTAPVAIETEPYCPPILLLTPGSPMRARLALPELHLHVLVDPGSGFTKLFSFAVHA
jgi:hypothetical protein